VRSNSNAILLEEYFVLTVVDGCGEGRVESAGPGQEPFAPSRKMVQATRGGDRYLGLLSRLEKWAASLRDFQVRAVVLVGPHSSQPLSREILLAFPARLVPSAWLLAQVDVSETRHSEASLVSWVNVEDAENSDALVSIARGAGATSYVRVEIPLPRGHGFECYVLCGHRFTGGKEAAVIAWSFMSLWPSVRLAVSGQRLGISAREMEVLMALADGETATEAAQRLGCAPRTVHFHSRNLMRKLGATNAASAVQRACALGIL